MACAEKPGESTAACVQGWRLIAGTELPRLISRSKDPVRCYLQQKAQVSPQILPKTNNAKPRAYKLLTGE
jgi:hypothetical protein